MSALGKKKDEWVVQTLCDFKENGRREVLRNHFSLESAFRSWDNFVKIYSKWGRCWQETNSGEVVNDTNRIG